MMKDERAEGTTRCGKSSPRTAIQPASWHEAVPGLGAPGLSGSIGIISRLLLLTGQRRNEVAEMRWQDVDLERRVWTLPREAAKNDKAHEIPLSPMVMEIMQSIPIFVGQEEAPAPAGKKGSHAPAKGTLVFPAQRGGTGAASGFSNAKRQMDKLILTADREAEKKRGGDPEQIQPLANWTLHDLRRTAASGMARLGFQPHVVEKVLNHSTGTISGTISGLQPAWVSGGEAAGA